MFDSLLSSALPGPRPGRNLAQRHLVQERCFPQPGGPDLARAAAQSGSGDAVSQEGQQLDLLGRTKHSPHGFLLLSDEFRRSMKIQSEDVIGFCRRTVERNSADTLLMSS